MKTNLLIITGIGMIITGFVAQLMRSYILQPTYPPVMRSLEGIEYLVVAYSHIFLLMGIIGIFVTIIGIILLRKNHEN